MGALEVSLRGGIVSLPLEDRDELRPGLEEATAFADRLIGAVELDGADAVPVSELALVTRRLVLGVVVRRDDDTDALDRVDRSEVLIGDRVVGDPGVDERHPGRAMFYIWVI